MDKLKYLLYLIPWIVVIPSIYLVHNCELERSINIELSPSEITQIRADRHAEGTVPDEMTVYLSELNDMSLKIYEAWIISQKRWASDQEHNFAFELDMITNKTFKTHKKDLEDLFVDVVENAKLISKKMYMMPYMSRELSDISREADKIWDIDEDESGHYEEECSTDSDGKESCTPYYVCDEIVYTYTYKPSSLKRTLWLTDRYLEKEYKIPEYEILLKPSSKTNAEGEYLVENTRSKDVRDKAIETYNADWIHKSTFMINIPHIRQSLSRIPSHRDAVQIAEITSHTEVYTDTSCGSGRPPYEMKVVSNYIQELNSVTYRLNLIWNGFQTTISKTHHLKQAVMQLIDFKLNRKGKSLNIDSDDIIEKTSEIQYANFNGVEKVRPYSYLLVISLSILFILLGGGATFWIFILLEDNMYIQYSYTRGNY